MDSASREKNLKETKMLVMFALTENGLLEKKKV